LQFVFLLSENILLGSIGLGSNLLLFLTDSSVCGSDFRFCLAQFSPQSRELRRYVDFVAILDFGD